MSYANILMYNAILPQYRSDKKVEKEEARPQAGGVSSRTMNFGEFIKTMKSIKI